MRSLRDLLISKREEKGLTINQVSYETNISKKYIEALEQEDFSVFPAEAYLLGFLRNYTEFLDLDYSIILSEYKNCLLREEPTPLSELMGAKPTFVLKSWMIYVPILLLILIFGVPPIVSNVRTQIEKRKDALRLAGEQTSKDFEITSEYTDRKIKIGDSYSLLVGSDTVTYLIREVTSDLILTETYKENEKVITLKLGNEVNSEFTDGNNKYIVSLFLKDIGGFSDNSAVMKVKVETKEILAFDKVDATVVNFNEPIAKDSRILMVNKRTPDPYSISIKFEGDILFRYQQKGEEVKENFYQKNSVFTMDITRSIKIWTSNAGLTKFKLNGEVLVLGRTGEVHVFTLRWLYITDKDEYRLEYATAY